MKPDKRSGSIGGSGKKREVPSILQKLLSWDVIVTNKICNWSNNFLPLRSLRFHYKLLEWSCHGIIWLAGWLAFIWLFDSPALFQMQVNFFIALLLDLAFVGILKAITRRRRPAANKADMVATFGPDKFSFPSGHSSRAVFIAYFCAYLWPVHLFWLMPIMAWAAAICASRLLMRRHHFLDVVGGAVLGHFEGVLLGWIWLSQANSAWVVSILSDERLDGGSYHV